MTKKKASKPKKQPRKKARSQPTGTESAEGVEGSEATPMSGGASIPGAQISPAVPGIQEEATQSQPDKPKAVPIGRPMTPRDFAAMKQAAEEAEPLEQASAQEDAGTDDAGADDKDRNSDSEQSDD